MSHKVYWVLFLLSVLSLALGGELFSIFNNLITEEQFKDARFWIVWILFAFSLITLLFHQAFIYDSLHKMEKFSDQWKNDFPGWFETSFESILRWAAFLMLLASVGKVIGMDNICNYLINSKINTTSAQKTLVLGSSLFFALLTLWNISAGLFSDNHNWRWDYLLSDFFAFAFWTVILLVLLGRIDTVATIPLLIILGLYALIIILRVVKPNFFKKT